MTLIKLKNLSLKRSITVATYYMHYRMKYIFHLSFSIPFISFICVYLLESVDIHYVPHYWVSCFEYRLVSQSLCFPLCWLKYWLWPLPLRLSLSLSLSTALRLHRISNNILQPKTHKFFIWCFIFSIPKLLLFIVLTWMH